MNIPEAQKIFKKYADEFKTNQGAANKTRYKIASVIQSAAAYRIDSIYSEILDWSDARIEKNINKYGSINGFLDAFADKLPLAD